MGGAVVHHAQQQLLGQDIELQRLQRLVGGGGVDGQVGDAAGLADLHIFGGAGGAPEGGGADDGDVGPGVQVLLEHVGHGQVQGQIAPAHDDIVLADVVQVVRHPGQGVHGAAVVPAPAGIAEGGQDAQAAVLAAQVPVLAGAQVVQEGLIVLVDDDAHVGDAGIDIVGEHKVDEAVAPAEGERTGVAGTGELTQVGISAIGKEKSVEVVHACSPPFTSSRIMARGATVAPAPMVTPPATTAMPQSGLSSGAEPT